MSGPTERTDRCRFTIEGFEITALSNGVVTLSPMNSERAAGENVGITRQ